MTSRGNGDLEPRARARRRVDRKRPPHVADAFLYHDGPLSHGIQSILRQASRKIEPSTVVVYRQRPVAAGSHQTDDHIGRAAVPPDVDERLLNDPCQLLTCARRERDFLDLLLATDAKWEQVPDLSFSPILLERVGDDWDCERLRAERDDLFPPVPPIEW